MKYRVFSPEPLPEGLVMGSHGLPIPRIGYGDAVMQVMKEGRSALVKCLFTPNPLFLALNDLHV